MIQSIQPNYFIKHIFIDEVQDYDPFSLCLLKDLYPLAVFTAVGDYNQNLLSTQTNLPVLKELNVKPNLDGYICDFNMNNINILEIAKKSLKPAYKPPKSEWNKYLDNNTTYNGENLTKVRCRRGIYLIDENKHTIKGEIIEISKQRASELECKDLIEII